MFVVFPQAGALNHRVSECAVLCGAHSLTRWVRARILNERLNRARVWATSGRGGILGTPCTPGGEPVRALREALRLQAHPREREGPHRRRAHHTDQWPHDRRLVRRWQHRLEAPRHRPHHLAHDRFRRRVRQLAPLSLEPSHDDQEMEARLIDTAAPPPPSWSQAMTTMNASRLIDTAAGIAWSQACGTGADTRPRSVAREGHAPKLAQVACAHFVSSSHVACLCVHLYVSCLCGAMWTQRCMCAFARSRYS